MKKNLLATTALSLTVLPALAFATTSAGSTNGCGFFAGVQGTGATPRLRYEEKVAADQEATKNSHAGRTYSAGLHAGYSHSFGQLAAVARVSGDHHFGETKSEKGVSTKFVWSAAGDVGVHYAVNSTTCFGLAGGLRYAQFHVSKTAGGTDYASAWHLFPYAQAEATVSFSPSVSGTLFAGYHIPSCWATWKTEETAITSGTKLALDGVYAGVGISYRI